jgi:hypothetical protein
VKSSAATISKGVMSILASVSAAVVLTACGGGGDFDDDNMAQAGSAGSSLQQRSPSAKLGTTYASGDFNPGIWNDHNWYECDCGKNESPSTTTPWKPAN